jgi:hypothetical protein
VAFVPRRSNPNKPVTQCNSAHGTQIYQGTLIPSILFTHFPLSLLKVCISAKSTVIQTGNPHLYCDARGIPGLGKHPKLKNLHLFSLFSEGRRVNWRQLCLDRVNNLFFFIHSDFFVLTQKRKVNYTSYRSYYSPTPSGEPWATKRGTFYCSESEAALIQAQRASASSSARFALRPDPSNPSLVFCSEK